MKEQTRTNLILATYTIGAIAIGWSLRGLKTNKECEEWYKRGHARGVKDGVDECMRITQDVIIKKDIREKAAE